MLTDAHFVTWSSLVLGWARPRAAMDHLFGSQGQACWLQHSNPDRGKPLLSSCGICRAGKEKLLWLLEVTDILLLLSASLDGKEGWGRHFQAPRGVGLLFRNCPLLLPRKGWHHGRGAEYNWMQRRKGNSVQGEGGIQSFFNGLLQASAAF